jgi:hypothetical protein
MSETPINAILRAGSKVRDGQWVNGAPSHVFAELLSQLEADGWELTPKTEPSTEPSTPIGQDERKLEVVVGAITYPHSVVRRQRQSVGEGYESPEKHTARAVLAALDAYDLEQRGYDIDQELRERLQLIHRFARTFATSDCDNCDGEGIDYEGGEWSLCECALSDLQAAERVIDADLDESPQPVESPGRDGEREGDIVTPEQVAHIDELLWDARDRELASLYGELATICGGPGVPRNGETKAAYWLRRVGDALTAEHERALAAEGRVGQLERIARGVRDEPPGTPDPVGRLGMAYATMRGECQQHFERRRAAGDKVEKLERKLEAIAADRPDSAAMYAQAKREGEDAVWDQVEKLREALEEALHRMSSVAGRLRVAAKDRVIDREAVGDDGDYLAELCHPIRDLLAALASSNSDGEERTDGD